MRPYIPASLRFSLIKNENKFLDILQNQQIIRNQAWAYSKAPLFSYSDISMATSQLSRTT